MDWPLFALRLTSGPLTLRPVLDDDLAPLADLFPDDDELDPAQERFGWLPEGADRRRIFVQNVWRGRGRWSPESWGLPFAVRVDGDLVGLQAIHADRFALLRTVDSGSWLTPGARGRGIGVAMRRAVLALAFDHLGAVAAISSARPENLASLGVSRRLGYVANGRERSDSTSGVFELQHVRLVRADWPGAPDVEVTGLDGLLPWFGVG